MSFFIDALLIAICVITVIVGTKRGFVKTLMSLVSTVIAFICSYTFTPALAEFLQNKFFLAPVADSIAKTIRSLVPAADGQFDVGLLFEDMPQTLATILERYNIDPAALQNTAETVSGQGGDAVQAMADAIALPIVSTVSAAVAFMGIFIIVSVALAIVTAIINSIFKLPVLKSANTLLGFLMSVAIAFIILFVYSSVVSSLVISLGSISPQLFGSDVIDKTLIVKFFSTHDFLSLVNNLLS